MGKTESTTRSANQKHPKCHVISCVAMDQQRRHPPPPPSRPLIKLQLGELEVNPLPREYWMPNGGQIARN